MHRRSALVALLALGWLVALAPRAMACTCAAGDQGHFQRAGAVFVGTVTLRDRPGTPDLPTKVGFAVSSVFKGDVPPTYLLETPSSGATCGIDFVPGEQYTVFARASETNIASTGSCDGTVKGVQSIQASGRDPIKTYPASTLLDPASHKRPRNDGARTGAIAAASLLAAVLALVIVRRIRARKSAG